MPLQAGNILRHRYRIEGVLGQGGMGAVYKAFDINLGVGAAVKENLFTTEEYARQFRREATILASLRHPNLPRVTDHFVIEGEGQYLVMDFIQGVDLRERLELEGSIPEEECLPWFLEISDALAYLHSRTPPILHRDIKPGNIKVMPDDRAMLVDFGLAKVVEQGSATTTGAKAMTPGFSPPEQYGTGRTDPRTDVYSLAATVYAGLTATIPEDSLERAMGREELTPLRKRNPEITPALAKVVTKGLNVDPAERYQTIGEMAFALNSATRSSQPTIVRNYPNIERTIIPTKMPKVDGATGPLAVQRIRKRRIPPLLVAGIAVVLIGVGAVASLPSIGPQITALFAGSAGTATEVVEDATATTGLFVTTTPDQVEPSPTVAQSEATATSEISAFPTETLPATSTPTGGGWGQIAYASNRSGRPQIYLVNIDGTDERQLTNLGEGACQPAWSPTGDQLIFTSPCRLNVEQYAGSSLWILDVDQEGNSSDPRQLRTAPGGDYDPAWDPNGGRLAFTSVRDNRAQIYVMNLDGSEVKNLTDDLAQNRQPVWSPNGSQLLFVSTRGGAEEIFIMPAEGGEIRRYSSGTGQADSHASWSFDGTLILFERYLGGFPRLIVSPVEDAGNRELRVCPEGPFAAQTMAEPNWSSDGQWIIFETWPDGVNHNIGILRSSCINFGEITTGDGWDFDAAWRPVP
jgi:serine/threonine protein kinase/Tol biopolymer transport system component